PEQKKCCDSTEGIIACTQPLAAKCSLKILEAGGNAVVTSGLNLTEPGSTGIGGDMFCLYYNAKTKRVDGLNGSGRAPLKCALEKIRNGVGLKDGEDGELPFGRIHAVTVPGAAAGWVDIVT
ncbi:hypothetical protein OIDMADRAFT_131236, partial [Oidiodendron maius Zn]